MPSARPIFERALEDFDPGPPPRDELARRAERRSGRRRSLTVALALVVAAAGMVAVFAAFTGHRGVQPVGPPPDGANRYRSAKPAASTGDLRFMVTYIPAHFRLIGDHTDNPFGSSNPNSSERERVVNFNNGPHPRTDAVFYVIAQEPVRPNIEAEAAHDPYARHITVRGHDAWLLPPYVRSGLVIVAWTNARGVTYQVIGRTQPGRHSTTWMERQVVEIANGIVEP